MTLFRILCNLRRFGQGFLLVMGNGQAGNQVIEVEEPFVISTEEVAEYAEVINPTAAVEKDGVYIIQSRTPEDCLIEVDENHIRGYFFELFPLLTEKEMNCRHKSHVVIEILQAAGFKGIEEVKL